MNSQKMWIKLVDPHYRHVHCTNLPVYFNAACKNDSFLYESCRIMHVKVLG